MLAGVGAYYFLNPKKALNIIIPEFSEVENIHVTLIGDTAHIDVDLRMQNKSFFKLNIDSLIYYVNFDSATLLAKSQYLNIELQPSQTDTLKLPLALPFKRLMKKIKSLQGEDSTNIKIDVRMVYATIFGHTSLPYTKTIRIAVPHPPKFEIEKIEYVSRDKKTIQLLAHVTMHNYGNIDLNVSDIKYNMVVKDVFKAEGGEKRNISIKPKSNISVKLPISVEFESYLKTLGLIITNNDKVNYHLTVTGMLQNDKVGDKKTPIQIEKDGILELKK